MAFVISSSKLKIAFIILTWAKWCWCFHFLFFLHTGNSIWWILLLKSMCYWSSIYICILSAVRISTNGAHSEQWWTFPRRATGLPFKIPQVLPQLIWEVTTESRWSEELQVSLVKLNVHNCRVKQSAWTNLYHGRAAKKPKKNTEALCTLVPKKIMI